jgi:hypothetical protein
MSFEVRAIIDVRTRFRGRLGFDVEATKRH